VIKEKVLDLDNKKAEISSKEINLKTKEFKYGQISETTRKNK
jgi:hypothetical protein